MNSYILELDQFIRSVEISKNDAFSALLGAGASITSGIPSANDCIWQWKKSIYESKTQKSRLNLDIKSDQVKALIQKWLDSEGFYPAPGDESEYSFYVEQCYPIEEDRRKYFQSICERREPSIGYKLLSLLHEAGIIQSVWTTNFDDLVRDAAIKTNNVPVDITLDSVERIIRAQNSSELLLVKLHGDYKYGPLKNTNSELKAQDGTFRARLIDYLNDKHLIVSGFSGRDHSVMDALMESYSKRGSGRLFWCGYGREIPQKVQELIEKARRAGRTAYYIPTDGFDKLFISLANACLKNDSQLHTKYQEYLKADVGEDVKVPFSIDVPQINSIIKSNAFQIQFPQEVFQFDFIFKEGEKPWQTLRELTHGKNIIAVPFKKIIWAFGSLSEINETFKAGMSGKVSRVPISDINIFKDSAIYSLLLSAITDVVAKSNNLNSDKRSLIWKSKVITQRRINDVIYFTHNAIRLSIASDTRGYFLTLMPDFYITTDVVVERIGKEIRQEIGRSYFERLWNKQFNEYVNEWRNLLFPVESSVLEIEYPANSGTGFIYKIRKSPVFAGLMLSGNSNVRLSDNFPHNLIHYKGIKYPEPLLVFSPRHLQMAQTPRDFHPMRGVSTNRPYDQKMIGTLFEDVIRLGIVCPANDAQRFSAFLKRHLTKVESAGINSGYLITFPGFFEAFGVSLDIPEPNTQNWASCPEPAKTLTIKDSAKDLRVQIIKSIDALTTDGTKKVIAIFVPKRWLEFCSYDIENEHYDLHDFIKAYCAERGIATQFIQEDTITDSLQCQINWWLSLSYYVKSLRTPWVLDTLDKTTAFAGIGYSIAHRDGSTEIVLGCSHIYNSQGQGLKYRLSKVEDQLFWDRQERPHLSYKDAYKFGLSIIDLFYTTMNDLPKRVVVHKRTFFTKDEVNGLKDSLLGNGIQDVDLIEINFEDDMRFVASKLKQDGMPDIDNFAIPRGTCILLNGYEALLWTHGVVPSVQNPNYKYYLGGRYIPGPLRVIKHYGKSNIGLIANEILGLTKMNWNSFDLYSQLPATVNSSNEIARIGKLLSKKEGITYDYRYFI